MGYKAPADGAARSPKPDTLPVIPWAANKAETTEAG